MTAKALGIKLNKKLLNLQAGEHLKPEFLKINPQHTIPTLVEGDFVLWESRAILVYLAEKYDKSETLYPKCPKKRAVINQRLYFDMGTLYQSFSEYYYPQIFAKAPADPEKYKKMEMAMDFLNTFLQNQKYAAGDTLTVADLALLATVSTFEVAGFDFSKYKNVAKWYANAKGVAPGFDENWAVNMDFYYLPGSAPCRSVLMTAKALGIELNKKLLNLQAGEHLKPEFLKINPQHTIPTLVDGDFALWESRAIMVYLVEKYGKNDSLFPKCPKKRAVINQRLYFDMGTLYKSFADYYYPQIFAKAPADPELYKKMEAAFDFLNTFLEGHQYVAGDSLTVADLALLASVSTFEVAGFDFSKYANVAKWYANAKTVAPGFDENWEVTMDFYYLPLSAPCRSILMTAKALGIELNKKYLDLFAGEHLKPEFLKINPQHTIPTLVDGDFALWESRAICIYLVEKYGKDDSLYPKCPKKQAVVNQRLYFDMGTMYASFANYYYPQVKQNLPADPEMFAKIEVAFDFLNTFLEGQTYVAGDSVTIADFALLATISTFDVAGFDFSKYANVKRWYEHCKTSVAGFEENWEGCLELKKWFNKE
ncbi:hypothetical protein FF38_11870 [Lucilia cuprina]|uniref:Glutathione S-transferase 1-1 n=1 Tax=Lucilia cuprina TaxID=7375 RepID=A0A0L0BYE0_LUCCU|nr:hypothetical protein FF38_11870 [Lucilia cuprina]